MKAKLFTKDLIFIDVIDISQISFKRQRNKEYTISCKPVSDVDYNWEQVSFIYFLDDNEEKTKRIQYKPCGYLEGYNGDSLSIKSMESYLESISVIPENFEWWQNKLLKNVLPDLCYGFRRIKKASLSEMQDVATSHHVKFDVLENGNGEVYADTGYYFSPSNTHELYYYSDGYVIYRMTLPAEARRQGLVLRWSDQTGTTTDVSVQFRWSNVSSDFIGTYSAEQSPLRGEGSRKNETLGVDIPESDNTYLFIKFNLKYDTGSTSVFPKGYNYEQEITTVQGEGEENYVYYGKTAILNAFEVIYRVDTRIEEGTISVSDTQLMQADLSNCSSLLSVLKAISEAYNLTFFVSFEENIPLLNVYNEYINDTTNQTIITDKINSTVTRKEIKTEILQAVEAFGIGNGFDRIHAFVKADDVETNIKNIGKYEGEETSVEELITNAKAYIEKENEELSSASFEYYNMPLQVNDKVRAVINKNVYTSLITEENYSFNGSKTEKGYTIGIRKYAFDGMFQSPFSGLFLYKPETPTNLIATRMEQGWAVSWQGKTSRYILQYRRSSVSPWNTLSITGTSCTIPFTEYDLDYTFAIYAVDDRGQYSDAMYVYSNSSSETIYVWETYHDGDTQPDTPTGSGNTGGWHRDLTQNAKWVSKKEAHRITDGSWSVPVLTSNGVRLGVLNDTPDDVTGISAYATKDGIQIECNVMGIGAKNVVQSFEFELLLEGASDWIWLRSFTNSAFYAFDRSVDGYPEADAIDGSQVRCKVKNTYNYISTNYATATVSTDSYGTWITTAPSLSSYASKRDFTVSATQGYSSREIYGNIIYRVEIKRYDDADYYKPNLTADPYASEDNYKDGTGYVTVTNYIQQRVPLETQATDPQSTSYTYRFTTVNATTGVVGDSATVTLIASASTAQDIVNHSMDAEKFNVQDLAAVSSVFGSIRSDGIAKDSNNFWNLSDPASALGYGEEGEMCVGTSASVEPYDPFTKPSGYRDNDSFFHFVPQTVGGVLKGLYMKLANFIITAINSTVTGTFIVLSRLAGKQLLRVSEEENKVYGLQRQTTYEDIENVTRVSGIEEYDTLDITEGGGVIYGVTGEDEKLLAYNTATDTEVAIDCEAGDNFSVCQVVGDEVVCVGRDTIKGYNLTDSAWVKYTSITYASVSISASNKQRYTSQIYNGKLYCPNDGSATMDIIDLSDNSYISVTISTTYKNRYTSQIYNGKLYCPNYNSTTMDIIDLSDNSYTSVTISATTMTRYTSQIYNGKLYCLNSGSTTMDIIDLSDNSYTSVTISATNKTRLTSQIHNGKLYCPNNGSTMDIIDLSDNSYTSVTISATTMTRYTSQIYNGKLYCPNNGSTMDIIDLSDNSYTSVTISATNKTRLTSQIHNGKLYCPNNGSTTMDIIDLSDNSYTSVNISSTNKDRYTSQIYNGKLYCPSLGSTTMDIIQLPLACADTHKTTKTYNNAYMYIVSANMVEKVDVLNRANTQLTLTSMPTPLASCSNSTDVYVVDLASGRIAKINATNAVTYTATTAKTGYLNYYCSGTTMYFTGRGAKVLKLNVTTGIQTEINLTTVLDNDLTYKVFYLSNYIYIFSQTSAVYFARVPTANFQLSAAEQYFLYNDIGNIRSRFWMGATTVYLAESRSGYMNKFTGILLDQQVTRDVQKEIGSGFVEREVNANGVTTLATADGDKIIFDAEKNLVASTATLATQANAIKPLGNYITLPAVSASVTKIIKIATVNFNYTGSIVITSSGSSIDDVVKVPIGGGSATLSGLRVIYSKNNTIYGIKKIIVTRTTETWDSPRNIYAEIATVWGYSSTTTLGVVETNRGTFTPSMTEVSSVAGTVVDSLSLNYTRGDISSYQHEFTKNIIGNLTGNADTATALETARKINNVLFDGTADIITQESPPTPWAQYSGKDIPRLPDNVAGTTYKRDNDWVSTDGWAHGHASIALSVENSMLKIVYNGTRPDTGITIAKSISATGKFIKGHIKCTVPITNVQYYSGTAYVSLTLVTPNAYETDFYGYMPTASPLYILAINAGQLTAKTCWLSQLYIGTGAYDRLVFDNSYHYRHLLNNAVIPTPQGLYFNGATSYLRSKEMVTLPDVFTFSATVNCAIKSTPQAICCVGQYTPPTIPFLWIARSSNSYNLIISFSDGTAIMPTTFINYFSGYENSDVDVKVEIDFISKTIKVYRNNIQFDSVASTPSMLKPVTDNIYFGNYVSTAFPLLGYMRNIQLFDTALTDTQRNWLAQGNTPPILYDVATHYVLNL